MNSQLKVCSLLHLQLKPCSVVQSCESSLHRTGSSMVVQCAVHGVAYDHYFFGCDDYAASQQTRSCAIWQRVKSLLADQHLHRGHKNRIQDGCSGKALCLLFDFYLFLLGRKWGDK